MPVGRHGGREAGERSDRQDRSEAPKHQVREAARLGARRRLGLGVRLVLRAELGQGGGLGAGVWLGLGREQHIPSAEQWHSQTNPGFDVCSYATELEGHLSP